MKKAIELITVFAIGVIITASIITNILPKVDLPEEYELITKENNLKGYFDSKGTLHIEFDHSYENNNNIKFIWNDDEESIPEDGTLIKLEYTDEDKIYIGPYYPKIKTE